MKNCLYFFHRINTHYPLFFKPQVLAANVSIRAVTGVVFFIEQGKTKVLIGTLVFGAVFFIICALIIFWILAVVRAWRDMEAAALRAQCAAAMHGAADMQAAALQDAQKRCSYFIKLVGGGATAVVIMVLFLYWV